jgi:hypothetical protein
MAPGKRVTKKRNHTSSLSQNSPETDQTTSKKANVSLSNMETLTFDEDGDLYFILTAKNPPAPDSNSG